MELAILGATSQIAKDLIVSLSENPAYRLNLYARRVDVVTYWLEQVGLTDRYPINNYAQFPKMKKRYDGILNFVGSGNPAQTADIGATILDVTYEFDNLALRYLADHPACCYIFFSSGAAYGGDFSKPAGDATQAQFPINDLRSSDWYGLAKLSAECRHRALPDLHIIDLRVFNYFSYSADVSARYLITDMLRAISTKQVFRTSNKNIYRDFAGPKQIATLIQQILSTTKINTAVDCYTRAPVDKLSLLEAMRSKFGMQLDIIQDETGLNATGTKTYYYSTSTKAFKYFGYDPQDIAMDVVIQEASQILKNQT
jgi:nucleoside-diphosphate-sugar epimerase